LPPEELTRYLGNVRLHKHTPKTVVDRERLGRLLKKVRTSGYALVDEELEVGLRSIAVPVTSRSGRVVAAMNSGVPAARVSAAQLMERILPVLSDHARLLGQLLA